MSCKRIRLIVNWLELFVQEVDSESFGVVVAFRKASFPRSRLRVSQEV